MDQKTLDHLQVAQRNRNLARTLLTPQHAGVDPPPWEWVAVINFYSAVHYVNAYLWERYHLSPKNHGERTYGVQQDVLLRSCVQSYDTLKDVGFHARYSEKFTVSEHNARLLLQIDLRAVEATVMLALGEQVPVW